MFNNVEIFKNTNNKPNTKESDWLKKDKLNCSFDLQLGLGRKIYWSKYNPISFILIIDLINLILERRNVKIEINNNLFGKIIFKTDIELDEISILSQNKILFRGIKPNIEIYDLQKEIFKKIVNCNKDLRNKYSELLFNSKMLSLEQRYSYGDKVSTNPEYTKTKKIGYIYRIIPKSTGVKYSLLTENKFDNREYLFNELIIID